MISRGNVIFDGPDILYDEVMTPQTFRAYTVYRDDPLARPRGEIATHSRSSLPSGEVTIAVECSSMNYKDALAATGHAGVVSRFPHIPGIDAAGVVVESASPRFAPGDEVIVTGYELGAEEWGGWSELIRVPADWVTPRPTDLSLRDCMILGTAGFTAAQCVWELRRNEVLPDSGPVVVTGATGGVGCVSVMLLHKLGYHVVAVTGKPSHRDWLRERGAREVIGREEVDDTSGRPLLSARWAGAVDSVGGNVLGTLLRGTRLDGCVAACGLVGGAILPVNVYPFILRGVKLAGVTSANCPRHQRTRIWELLNGPWRLGSLEAIATTIEFSQLHEYIPRILVGQLVGRTVVVPELELD